MVGCEDWNKLEERISEPEPLQGNEGLEREDVCLWERPNAAKAGGSLSLLVSPEFKLCWL